MNKICLIISFIIFILLLSVTQSVKNYIEDFIEDYDIKYEEKIKNFQRKYLIKNKLIENDRLIKPEEMRKIFIDIMLEGAPLDELDEFTRELYEELARFFLDKYYKEKKVIKGMDIYNLMDIKEIFQKLYELNGEMPIYDNDYDYVIDDDDDDDDDNKDDDYDDENIYDL